MGPSLSWPMPRPDFNRRKSAWRMRGICGWCPDSEARTPVRHPPMRASGSRGALAVSGRRSEELGEFLEVACAEVGNRPVSDAIPAPGDDVVALDRAARCAGVARQC